MIRSNVKHPRETWQTRNKLTHRTPIQKRLESGASPVWPVVESFNSNSD